MSDLSRYSLIENGPLPRELCLLQGKGCKWGKCTFCDYYLDVSPAPFEVNKKALSMVTGKTGCLDLINSGSCFELDRETIRLVQNLVKERNIESLWFEAHWMYKDKLKEFSELFDCDVHFRFGVETFNPNLRTSWNKGIGQNIEAPEIAKYFDGVCLLVGIRGQTIEDIYYSIDLAEKHFSYYNVNVFCPNSTKTEKDDLLIEQFKKELIPVLRHSNKCEVLVENTSLGVG